MTFIARMAEPADYPRLYDVSGLHPTDTSSGLASPTLMVEDSRDGSLAAFIGVRDMPQDESWRLTVRNLWAPGRPILAAHMISLFERYLRRIGIRDYYFTVRPEDAEMYNLARRLEGLDMLDRRLAESTSGAIMYRRVISSREPRCLVDQMSA